MQLYATLRQAAALSVVQLRSGAQGACSESSPASRQLGLFPMNWVDLSENSKPLISSMARTNIIRKMGVSTLYTEG